MESQQASPAAYAKKLADGGRYSGGKHEYDGLFTGPMKLGSTVEDYREIFGRSETSSIPMLDVPELNEQKAAVEPRGSRPDYAKIFGGFGEADFAMPYDELISRGEKEMKSSPAARAPAELRSQFSPAPEQSAFDERKRMSAEAYVQSSMDGTQHVNVLYHKTNSGGRMGKSGMTHVAQLHAIPGFTRLIDENGPSQSPEGARSSRYVLNDVHLNSNDEMKEARPQRRAYSGPLLFSNPSGQHAEHHRTSSSISNDAAFYTSNRSSMKSKLGIPKSAAGSYSPPFLDDEVDANSAAAASAAAVRKAIEEAQAKIKIAKELMERKKEGRQSRSRLKVNHGLKSEKREAKSTEKTYQYKEEAEELYRKDDTPMKQVFNGSLGQHSAEVRRVTLDFRDETKGPIASPAHTIKLTKEAAFSEVDSRRAETGTSKSEHGSPEAASSKGYEPSITQVEHEEKTKKVTVSSYENKWKERVKASVLQDKSEHGSPEAASSKGYEPSITQVEHEEKTKKVTVSSYENKWKERMKASVLQDKFENIMRMLRGPADVEVPEKNLERLKGDHSELGSEAKHEELKGRLNEAAAREDERTVKVKSWLDNIAKGHKEQEHDGEEGETKKPQSCDLRQDDAVNTSRDVDAWKTSKVRVGHDDLEDAGEKMSPTNGWEEVKEKVEEEAKENKHAIGRHGEDSFSEFVETERMESEVHQRSEVEDETDKVTQEPPRSQNDYIEVAPKLHKSTESETNVEQIDEIHVCGELAVRLNEEATMPSYGPRDIEKEPEAVEETYPSAEEGDSARVDGAGVQRDEPQEPLIIDENGVCSGGVAYNFNCQQTEDGTAECERTSIPERHVEEGTTQSEESKENVDDAEVSSTSEATTDNFQPLGEEKVSPNQTESRSHAEPEKHVEEALSDLEEDDKVPPPANNSTPFLDEERLSDDGVGTSRSQQSSVSEEEGTDEAAASSGQKTSKNVVDETELAYYKTMQMQEREDKQSPEKDMGVERKQHLRKQEAEKDLEKEKERQRIAVERAIREARERAFADAREKAEKAASERAAAEAERRAKAAARERSERATALEKAAAEAKLKAERAAVERATAEARERALEKALSEKASVRGRNYGDKSPAPSKDDGRSTDQRYKSSGSSSSSRYQSSVNNAVPNSTVSGGASGASSLKSKASSEKQQQMAERAAKALAEKNMRDLLVQKEQAEKNRLAEILDAEIKRWSSGKERNLRVLLSTLHYILGPDSGWQAIPRTDLNSATAVRKAYKKATLFVHPDKLQQRGASIRQKYVCEKVFELLKDAWSRFSAEDR
ncbi:unnamed protein product [Linum trigynum]|uniref:J domain-containing protein n=1 Tax=Linum trigynum TaxID=586398 RepID=A0AAV2EF38_9ROSI